MLHRLGIAIFVLLGLGLAQKPLEITLWHTAGPPGQEPFEAMVAEFNAAQSQYKITPRYQGDYREAGLKLLNALRAGGAPTLFHAEISFLGQMVKEGIAVPLDEYLNNLPNDFYPGFLETGRFQGKTYGLPIGLSVPIFFYNADQFRARNIPVPTDWNQVAEAAAKLSSRAAKGLIVSSDIWSFNALVMSRGGDLVNAQGRPDFTHPKVVESLEFLQKIVRAGHAQSRNIAEAQFSVADFLRTKAFMGLAPITIWPLIEDRAPIPFRLGVAAVPLEQGGKVPLAGGALVVLKGASTEQVKGAVAFWRFLMEPKNIARWVKATYYLPMRRSAQPLLEDFYKEDPRRRVAFSQVKRASPWIRDPEVTVWYTFLEEALEKALKGNVPARQALEEAQRKAEAVERK